jgi:hypothetical protein
LSLLGTASTSLASILLPGDLAMTQGTDNTSARVDLTVDQGAATASLPPRGTPAQNHEPAAEDEIRFDWQNASHHESSPGSTGSSTPSGASSSGASALFHAVAATSADVRVIGWLHDASHFGLPEGMPQSLLRPPQG